MSVVGTPNYIAPELIGELGKMSTKVQKSADVWAFGVVLWELATRQKPFEEFANPVSLSDHMRKAKQMGQYLLTLTSTYWNNPILKKILESCLSWNPDERPTFSWIRTELDKL